MKTISSAAPVSGDSLAVVQSTALWQNFVDNAVEAIFQIAPNGRILACNPALYRLLRFSGFEELTAKMRNALLHCVQDRRDRKALVEKLRQEGRASDFETIVLRSNATGFWGSLRVNAITNDAGRVLYFAGNLVDISERMEAERFRARAEAWEAEIRGTNLLMAALCQKASELLRFSLSANQLAFSTPDEALRLSARKAGVKSGRKLKGCWKPTWSAPAWA